MIALTKILLLEDRLSDIGLIKYKLKKLPYDTVLMLARNKVEFVQRLDQFSPHLILSDYHLPDTNGLEMLLHVRSRYPNIPFIFVTGALKKEEMVAAAILKGATSFVLKEELDELPGKIEESWADYQLNCQLMEEQRDLEREMHLQLQKALELSNQRHDDRAFEISRLLQSVRRKLRDLSDGHWQKTLYSA